MTSSTESDLLAIISALIIPIAWIYLIFHLIRYVVILINRGIDHDRNRGPIYGDSPLGHHRYAGGDDPDERDSRRDPCQAGIDWLHQRCQDRRAVAHDKAHDRAHEPTDCVELAAIVDHRRSIVRRPFPIRTVIHGRYAGARVRVLMESREWEGLWFVEVVEGTYGGPGRGVRGDILVVAREWLG